MRHRPPNRGKFPPAPPPGARSGQAGTGRQFERLNASALYCPKCRQATPTREFLLLVLPDGNLYDYRCALCGTSTGSKTEKTTGSLDVGPP